MDDRQFDSLVRSLASGANRRQILKGLLGLGGAAAVAGTALSDAEAARRPTPTPQPPRCPGQQTWDGTACVCPAGNTTCGPACCPDGQAECCDNACCYGTCYGEELCCPTGRDFCAITGECCPEGWSCCPEYGCLEPGLCCTAEDCIVRECAGLTCTVDHTCRYSDDCTNGGVEECCLEGQVCLDNGTCCTPICDADGCGDDGCGGTCGCPDGYGCGDDGRCHVCSVCSPVSETCGRSCYTLCTPDGVKCLSGFAISKCSSQSDCTNGAYCMETCRGLMCLSPCQSGTARFAQSESEGIDVIAG